MADQRSAAHASHDQELVAGCTECDELAPDLAAISASLGSLRGGADSGHRDFQLTPDDAQRLRRGRGLRAWLRPLAGPRFGFARPLGSALTLVALVGVVASSVSGPITGGAGLEAAYVPSDATRDSGGPAANPEPSRTSVAAALDSASPKADTETDAEYGSMTGSPDASASDALLASLAAATTAPTTAPGVTYPGGGPTGNPNGIFLASLVLLPIGLLLVFGRGLARFLIGPAREP